MTFCVKAKFHNVSYLKDNANRTKQKEGVNCLCVCVLYLQCVHLPSLANGVKTIFTELYRECKAACLLQMEGFVYASCTLWMALIRLLLQLHLFLANLESVFEACRTAP